MNAPSGLRHIGTFETPTGALPLFMVDTRAIEARTFARDLGATVAGFELWELSENETAARLRRLGFDEATTAKVILHSRTRRASRGQPLRVAS